MDNINNIEQSKKITESEPSHTPFKLTKPSVSVKEYSTLSYVTHAALALIVGISVVSFLTQGVLALKDIVFSPAVDSSMLADTMVNTQPVSHSVGQSVSKSQERGLGSDDSSTTSSDAVTSNYTLADGANFPKLTAGSYLVADLKTGEIIYEKNENLVAPIASVSKLMTATIALENLDIQKEAIVSRDAYNTFGAEGELVLGEKIKLYDLMHPLLMESSNDGAEVFTEAYSGGRDAFMALMNKKAVEIGMHDTYYEDPSGLNPKNVSSVEDLLKLARYIYQNHPEIYDMTHVRQYSILKHTWFNKNRFLNYENFIGGKNGYIDESKKTTVSLFNITMARGGTHAVVVVLLKSDDREGDALKLINFLKKNAYYQDSVSQDAVGVNPSLNQ